MYSNGNRPDFSPVLRRRKREQTVRILKMVSLGVLLLGIGAVPPPWAIPRIIRELTTKDTPENRRRIRRKINYLKQQEYINMGRRRYELTGSGKRIVREISMWDSTIPVPKSWAGMWYLIIFDIPTKKSGVRIPFIRHLQNLGLVFYQRSVWIYPHPFEQEVRKISDYYGITPYISFITAVSIDGSDTLKRKFRIPS